MSLRVRLVLLIVAMVALVALALSALHLTSLVNTLSADALKRSELAGQQVNAVVADRINHDPNEPDPPANLEERKARWNDIVASDPDIDSMLTKTMALYPAIVEINIADQAGRILASSNPSQVNAPLTPHGDFSAWLNGSQYRRLLDLMVRRPDYQVNVKLGFAGQADPIFTIQVVTSSVLLRSELLPEVRALAVVSGGALLVSLLLIVLATNRVLRPLKRIEQTIDRIVQGNYGGNESNRTDAKEFAAVESKLNILGQQFRGARQEATELQHNLDLLLERMASQLDVASRLAAISRITGGVAHEIKNPLNAISLRLDLLRARIGAPEEELIPEIDILSKEVTRLDRVVKTFLDFSRPVEVKLEEIDLEALTREVAELMTPQARLANIELRFEAPVEAVKSVATAGSILAVRSTNGSGRNSTWIRGDADMLKQAVLNLVTNALDAMKNGGNLLLSVAAEGETVALNVADNGPGIPQAVREKVFQLYFTTKSRGSGIGLAMTYRAVQLHNGTIDFTSEDGRGTTFHLRFPAVAGHV
ncbi:MAG: ATP-binding protein [Bryobacteraceae bacterium]|jgi:signal transduction histidine kinase